MKRVYFDTNSLLLPFRRKVDVFSEVERVMQEPHQCCIVQETVTELEKLAENARKGTDKQAAKLGLILLKQKNLKRVRGFFKESHADDALIKNARPGDVVVTQDKDLKKSLKERGVTIMTLRQQRYLVIS